MLMEASSNPQTQIFIFHLPRYWGLEKVGGARGAGAGPRGTAGTTGRVGSAGRQSGLGMVDGRAAAGS